MGLFSNNDGFSPEAWGYLPYAEFLQNQVNALGPLNSYPGVNQNENAEYFQSLSPEERDAQEAIVQQLLQQNFQGNALPPGAFPMGSAQDFTTAPTYTGENDYETAVRKDIRAGSSEIDPFNPGIMNDPLSRAFMAVLAATAAPALLGNAGGAAGGWGAGTTAGSVAGLTPGAVTNLGSGLFTSGGALGLGSATGLGAGLFPSIGAGSLGLTGAGALSGMANNAIAGGLLDNLGNTPDLSISQGPNPSEGFTNIDALTPNPTTSLNDLYPSGDLTGMLNPATDTGAGLFTSGGPGALGLTGGGALAGTVNNALTGGLLDGIPNGFSLPDLPNLPPGSGTILNAIVGGATGGLGGAQDNNNGGGSTAPVGVPNWGNPVYPAPTRGLQGGNWTPGLSYNEQAGLLASGVAPPQNYLPLHELLRLVQPPPAPRLGPPPRLSR